VAQGEINHNIYSLSRFLKLKRVYNRAMAHGLILILLSIAAISLFLCSKWQGDDLQTAPSVVAFSHHAEKFHQQGLSRTPFPPDAFTVIVRLPAGFFPYVFFQRR
jgi:hypothetical protein